MQGSPSGKLEDAFVVIRSAQKEVANMEEDREYYRPIRFYSPFSDLVYISN